MSLRVFVCIEVPEYSSKSAIFSHRWNQSTIRTGYVIHTNAMIAAHKYAYRNECNNTEETINKKKEQESKPIRTRIGIE